MNFIVFAMIAAALATAQTLSYTVTDLGPVGGPPGQPYVVNNMGLINGGAVAMDGTMHAVLWNNKLKMDIGTPGLGGLNSVAFGLNDKAQVVGAAETAAPDPNGEDFCGFRSLSFPSHGTTCMPFFWQNNVMTPLPTLNGGNNGLAEWINNQGVAAGMSENGIVDSSCAAATTPQMIQFKPVLWKNGQIQELPVAPGDPDGLVYGINDSGQAAGGSGDCAALQVGGLYLFPRHALLWRDGNAIDLGNLGGKTPMAGNIAFYTNNPGQTVGISDIDVDGVPTFHGFLWTKQTGMRDLGTLPGDVASVALNINDAGEVVGISFDPDFNLRAYLRYNGVMTDLNTLIPGGSPLLLLAACSINSRGQIVGWGATSTGEIHGYLATPQISIVVTGPGAISANTFQTILSSYSLSAIQTTSPNAGPISYSWMLSRGYPTAAILSGNTATPVLQFPYRGTYQFILTVTDSTGATATTTVTVQYV